MTTLAPGDGAAPAPLNPRSAEVRAFLYSTASVGEDERYRQIDRYEAHFACKQYSHLQYNWWGLPADSLETISPSIQVPMGWEQPMLGLNVLSKRPSAPLNLARAVVDRFTGLLFSNVRAPRIECEGDDDTEGWLRAAMEASQFWARMRLARSVGGSCGSVLMTASLRDGVFDVEVHNPKHCTILWKNKRRHQPEAVLVMYKVLREELDVDPKTGEVRGTKKVPYLYRRIISEQEDVVFKPVRMERTPAELKWEVESRIEHDLGFFPGVWVQNLPVLGTHDGDPDCQGGFQMLDAMDRLISQCNKGTLFNLDPTLVLSLDAKEIESLGGSVRKGSDNALHVGASGGAKYLEMNGTGVKTALEFAGYLEKRFLNLVRCVIVDPEAISGSAQSAKAIEYIYAPMLEKADDLRAQWGDLGVIPLLRVMERIGRHFQAQKGRNWVFLMPKKVVEGEDGEVTYEDHKLGNGGYLKCVWGPYFSPTETDQKQRIDNAVSAKAGGLIDGLSAIKHTAAVFDIQRPDQIKAMVDAEAEAQMAKAMESLDAQVPFEGSKSGGGEEEKDKGAGEGGKP